MYSATGGGNGFGTKWGINDDDDDVIKKETSYGNYSVEVLLFVSLVSRFEYIISCLKIITTSVRILVMNRLKILVMAGIIACTVFIPQYAFCQQQYQSTLSGNTSKNALNVPSNISRIEITLKNDQSSERSSLDIVIPSLIALVGTAIGSFMTYLLTKKIEDQKAARDIIEQEEFAADLRNRVSYDLEKYLEFLHVIHRNPNVDDILSILGTPHEIRAILEDMPVESKDVPIERKMRALGGITLAKVESAYRSFAELSDYLKRQISEHVVVDRLLVDRVIDSIQEALVSIKKQE